MNKDDWTILFIRVLGLYLLGTHIATFITTTAALIIAMFQPRNAPQIANIYIWQGPVVSLLVLGIGLFFLTKAAKINAAIQRGDSI